MNTTKRIFLPIITSAVILFGGFISPAHSANSGDGANVNHQRFIAAVEDKPLDIDNDSSGARPTRVEKVPFGTRIKDESNLPKGVEVVVQEGSDGERSFFTSFQKSRDSEGKTINIPVETSEVTVLPIEKVIIRGTNTEVISGIDPRIIQKEAEKKARAEQAAKSSSSPSPTIDPSGINTSAAGTTSPAENRAFAKSLLNDAEFVCADRLVNRESGWSTTAQNASSGAYGLPQSLPGSKMASAGSDWQTNGKTQFKWMIGYVQSRYGSFCNAAGHSDTQGWY